MRSCYSFVAGVAVIIVFNSSSLLAAEPEVSCQLKVTEKYDYYDITGACPSDLRSQMKQGGTKWNDGKVYSAVTSWDIKYGYEVFVENGRCSIKSVKTDVEIVYRLPRWVSCTSGSELTGIWDSYLERLKHHEFGHKDIAVKAATEVNEVLASLSGFDSQTELDQEASLRAEEKFRHMKQAQVEYDQETRHGETQGAVLP